MEKEDKVITIKNLLKILNEPLVVIDVGARWGFQEHWKQLGALVQLFGMDADDKEVQSLNRVNQSDEYFPKVLGSHEGHGTLHVTQDPACSSLYPPDEKLIRSRPSMYVTKLVSTEKVELTTLDSWIKKNHISKVDFIKLDVQGAELDVLKGAKNSLQSVRMLEVEVQFNPLYRGVPLFGDVDKFLREQGFSLWRINNICHYGVAEFSLLTTTDEEVKYDYFVKRFNGRNGQLYWADAFYVREEIAYNMPRTWDVSLRDACMARVLKFEDLFISSLINSLTVCPPAIEESIKTSFGPEDTALSMIESYPTSFEVDQPKQIGYGIHDEYVELEHIKKELEYIKLERDQAVQQLQAFHDSRAFKMISFLQSIYRFFSSRPKQNFN